MATAEFFGMMRRPEMALVRGALKELRDDRGVDWRQITSLDIVPPYSESLGRIWWLFTDEWHVMSYPPYTDFSAYPNA